MYIYVLIYVRYCIIYVTHEHVLLNVNKVFSLLMLVSGVLNDQKMRTNTQYLSNAVV